MGVFLFWLAHSAGQGILTRIRAGMIVAVHAGLLLCAVMFTGCASIMVPAVAGPLVDGLPYQEDVQLVCDGAPSYLLMLDSLLVASPRDPALLLKAAQAYTAYADVSVECGQAQRAVILSEKARRYGRSLLFPQEEDAAFLDGPLPQFTEALKGFGRSEVERLFWGGFSWAGWIRYQGGSAAAMADLVKVEKIMQRVLELDENYYYGGAHIFLGFYYGARPALYGGNPESSAAHFERALAISGRELLAVQVAYAETYAQLTFNRQLYEELLNEVLRFQLAEAPEHTLSNQLAKLKAGRLLEEIDTRF